MTAVEAGRVSREHAVALILQASIQQGLPFPGEISFREDLNCMYLDRTSCAALRAWAPVVNAEVGQEHGHATIAGTFLRADTAYGATLWHGWRVSLSAHDERSADPELTALADELVAATEEHASEVRS